LWQSTHLLPGSFSLIQSGTATGLASGYLITGGVGAATMKAFVDAKNQNKTKDDSDPEVRSKL
jgi:hypothetical protein